VAAARRQFIQQAHAVVRQRHLAGQRHLGSFDQADSREGMMQGPKRAGGDEGKETGDASPRVASIGLCLCRAQTS
jgi:hypothetical protein